VRAAEDTSAREIRNQFRAVELLSTNGAFHL
jgi:hypothetical protein